MNVMLFPYYLAAYSKILPGTSTLYSYFSFVSLETKCGEDYFEKDLQAPNSACSQLSHRIILESNSIKGKKIREGGGKKKEEGKVFMTCQYKT